MATTTVSLDDRLRLVNAIRELFVAFQDVEPPEFEGVPGSLDWEYALRETRGRRWSELHLYNCESASEYLAYLDRQWTHYYLPGFILNAVFLALKGDDPSRMFFADLSSFVHEPFFGSISLDYDSAQVEAVRTCFAALVDAGYLEEANDGNWRRPAG